MQIYDWMDSLQQAHKDDSPYVHVETINIGNSYEGRMMRVLKVSSNWTVPNYGTDKSAIWIDGGMKNIYRKFHRRIEILIFE